MPPDPGALAVAGTVARRTPGLSRRDVLRVALAGGAWAASGALGCTRGPRPRLPSVLLVTLDTTRVDRLGCYGYEAPTSPALDRLAREAMVFERAYATSSWTLPSHASLFTGRMPNSHGARKDPDGPLNVAQAIDGDPRIARLRARGLEAGQATLAELCTAGGYRCGGIVAGPWMKALFGLERGFEHWDDVAISTENGRSATSVADAALRWLAADDARPFLLFLNFFDAHTPYRPPPATLAMVHPGATVSFATAKTLDELSTLYDGELRVADDGLARVLDALRARGLFDEMMIVVTADHGELLGEHGGFGHGKSLWEEEIRIPLLVKCPRGEVRPGRSDALVQLTDLLPLVAERLGLELPEAIEGAWPPRRKAAFAEVHPLAHESEAGRWRMWLEDRQKLLSAERGPRHLFDLAQDPRESRNLAMQDPALARRLAEQMQAFAASLPPPPAVASVRPRAIDAETQRALRSLGYVE